jgi:hypothetical protein
VLPRRRKAARRVARVASDKYAGVPIGRRNDTKNATNSTRRIGALAL